MASTSINHAAGSSAAGHGAGSSQDLDVVVHWLPNGLNGFEPDISVRVGGTAATNVQVSGEIASPPQTPRANQVHRPYGCKP